MMWYFLDGFLIAETIFRKIIIRITLNLMLQIDNFEDELVFLKSKKTSRWWMVVSSKRSGKPKI